MDIITVAGSRPDDVRDLFDVMQLSRRVRLIEVSHPRDLQGIEYADRVLLQGGHDIHPSLYGQGGRRTSPWSGPYDRRRDGLEYAITKTALDNAIPIMGICRGMQMMAAVAGGTLWQDWSLTKVRPHLPWHDVKVTGPLKEFVPADKRGIVKVNSYHHQSVRQVPRGFRVAAKAHDGTIEAIYRPTALGVQWHPETMAVVNDAEWLDLFTWLVDGLLPAPKPEKVWGNAPHTRPVPGLVY